MPADAGDRLQRREARRPQAAVTALGEVEIGSEHLHLPASAHKACRHLKLARMAGQIRGVGELVDQPETGHAVAEPRETVESWRMVFS